MAEDQEQAPDIKPDNPEAINIKVRGQDQSLLQFKVTGTLLVKICKRQCAFLRLCSFWHILREEANSKRPAGRGVVY
jgi:hypothetical protein